jgi:hypothetical protein
MTSLLKMTLLLALSVLSQSFSAYAAPVACTLLEESWRSHYVRDMKIAWPAESTFDCHHEARFALSIYDLEQVKFEADAQGQVPKFYQILKNAQKGMRDQKNLRGSCKTALAFARSPDQTITICPAFYDDNRIDRASTLMHESRHLSPNDPGHVICRGGSHKGEMACDRKFMDGKRLGSGYNADMNYLSAILKRQIGNDLSRSIAQQYINYYIGDSFNEITGAQIRAWHKDLTIDAPMMLPEVNINATRTHADSTAVAPVLEPTQGAEFPGADTQ